jgi:hypothetical protein
LDDKLTVLREEVNQDSLVAEVVLAEVVRLRHWNPVELSRLNSHEFHYA